MELNTASAVISFARKLEEDGIKLYESLAQKYPQDRQALLAFAGENKKNIIQIERAYYGMITDAIEGCFSFKIYPEQYRFETGLAGDLSYSDALSQAINIEDRTIKFYSDAAEQSKSLLADIHRTFAMVAKKRSERCSKLKAVLSSNS
jgi:rubrerythrin